MKKTHSSIQAYGTVDELNSWIGLIKDNMDSKEDLFLTHIQKQLFTIGSYLATGNNSKMMIHLPKLSADPTTNLEKAIDEIQQTLPEMKRAGLPGGSTPFVILSYS